MSPILQLTKTPFRYQVSYQRPHLQPLQQKFLSLQRNSMISSEPTIQTLSASLQSCGVTKVSIEIDLKTLNLSLSLIPALTFSEAIPVRDSLWRFLPRLSDKDFSPDSYRFMENPQDGKYHFQLSLLKPYNQLSLNNLGPLEAPSQEKLASMKMHDGSLTKSTKNGCPSQMEDSNITVPEDLISLLNFVWSRAPSEDQLQLVVKIYVTLIRFLATPKSCLEKP